MSEDVPMGQEAALAEFNALRSEIITRQNNAHSLLSIQLTAAGALFSFALADSGRAAILLVLPLITYMLAGRHVAHSYACLSIGTYIRTELSARTAGGLGWEEWLRLHRSKPRRYRIFNPQFVSFPGISILALLGAFPYLARSGTSLTSALLWLSWIAGIALTATSAHLVWKIRGDSFLWNGPNLGPDNGS